MTHPAPKKKFDLANYDGEKELSRSFDRISKVRSSLLLTNPFFGALALQLKPKPVDVLLLPNGLKLMTMATDGQHLYFSPMWLSTISDVELKGVYCHEVMHCALGHPFRRGERDPERFNIACDGAINRLIGKMGLTLPKGGVGFEHFEKITKEQYETFNAEQLYPYVKANPQGKGKGDGEGEPDGELPWGSVIDAPPKNEQGKGRAEQEADWKVKTLQAANAAKLQGRLPADLEQIVSEITRNRVDWKSVLRRFVQAAAKNDYTWRRPSSRYAAHGMYMPSLHDERVPPIVVVFDTSGSCWNEQGKFFGELTHILDEVHPEAIHFIQCDAAVEKVDVLMPGDELVPSVHGGGGTTFKPPFEWVKAQGIEPACLIYLTDTYGDFPDEAPSYPVMWAVTVKDRECPFGETMYIGDD